MTTALIHPRSVVVAGMHRSGTSLTASLLAAMGVDMGERLVAADRTNARGFFEDRSFVEFHQQAFRHILRPHGRAANNGHGDWGWNGTTQVTSEELAPWTGDARELVRHRDAAAPLWGFKDPRATLVLDFWDPLLPDPVYVAVYRAPHRVASSIQRLAADVFLRNPGYAWKLWTLYNRRLLDFVQRHRGRCFLMDVDAIHSQLDELPELLRQRLRLPLEQVDLRQLYCASLLETDDDAGYFEAKARLAWHDGYELYDELQREADLPRPLRPAVPSSPTVTPMQASSDHAPVVESSSRSIDLSIIIPTHNDAVLLVEALASAERCSAGRHEILIGDDGSNDSESLRILDSLANAGHVILRQPHSGLSAMRNLLVAQSRGRFVLPLDADNRLVPGFIERAFDLFRRDPGLGVVYGDRRLFGQLSGELHVAAFNPRSLVYWNEIDACAMIRREVWEQVGGYDTRLFGLEDWEFWLNASKHGWRLEHLPGVAFEYRVRPGSLLERCGSRASLRRLRRLMLAKHGDLLTERMPAPLRQLVGGSTSQPRRWQRALLWCYWQLAWRIPQSQFAARRKELYEALSVLKRQDASLHRDS